MSDPTEVQVSEPEERYLRAFVRRQMLPWFAASIMLVLFLAAASFAVATHLAEPVVAPSARALGEAAAAAGAGNGAAPVAALSEAELTALREQIATQLKSELEKELRSELVTAPSGNANASRDTTKALAEVRASLGKLEKRVVAAERAAKAGGKANAPIAGVASSDLRPIMKRVGEVEARQDQIEKDRAQFAKDTLNRLYNVETSRDVNDETRIIEDQKRRARLENLESRFSHVEELLGTLPASPGR